jgi:hypothetical protein
MLLDPKGCLEAMTKHVMVMAGLLSWASTSFSATPVLNNLRPQGIQRGTEIVVDFNGARLADAKSILFYEPGITVTELKVVNDNQLKIKLKAAPDCPLGEHACRVVAESGISELRTFFVGTLPQVEEKEPNGDLASAQEVPFGSTVAGVVTNEDVDYYKVAVKKGQRISAEVEGLRLGNTMFDPAVAILNQKRFVLASSDDSFLLNQDCACSTIAPEDGTYFVEVRESAYQGDGNSYYRVHIGSFPRPTAIYPAGGKAGETLDVRLIGDAQGVFQAKVALPGLPSERFPFFPQTAEGISPSPNWMRVSEFGNVLEAEPNDEVGKATKTDVALPLAFNGIIEKPGDRDFFKFKAVKGQVFDVACRARSIRTPLDPVLHIHYADGRYIAGNDDAIGPDSYLRFQVPADGEYCIHVHDHLLKGGPDYVYRVEFVPVKAKLTFLVPEFVQYQQERRVIAVPRGGRMASLLVANRADFGGELNVVFKDLPKGVKATAEKMDASVNVMPILFEAAADAPLGATLADVQGLHVDPKAGISGGFSQDISIVFGPPNVTQYWKYTCEKLAVAVVNELPFRVKIMEPKAPLSQDGNMNLKVVVERQKDFKGAVTVYNIFNPPGVSSVPAITIPPDKTEGDYAFSANRGAQPKEWKLAFQAVSDAGKGPIWTSTQLCPLRITSPYAEVSVQMAAAEQGKPVEVVCKVDQKIAFEGKATATLVGLPAHVTSKPLEINKDTKEIVFKVEVGKDAPPGQHKSLFCQLSVPIQTENVLANLGYGGVLRIDPPPPPKKNEPAKPAVAQAQAPAPTPNAAPPKRLSRLEQLRLEQAEKAKAAGK